MKSAEFRVPLAVAGRLARAEMKDRNATSYNSWNPRNAVAPQGAKSYHSAKVSRTQLQNSALSTQHSALSTECHHLITDNC